MYADVISPNNCKFSSNIPKYQKSVLNRLKSNSNLVITKTVR